MIARPHPLTKRASWALNEILEHSLAVEPGQRFATDAAWLSATDQLINRIKANRRDGSLLDRLLTRLGRAKRQRDENGPLD